MLTIPSSSQDITSGGSFVAGSAIHIHPKFKDSELDWDVAIWKLNTSIPESDTIKYAKLPATGSDPSEGTMLSTAGWGWTKENAASLSKELIKVDIPVVARDTCNKIYKGLVSENMICAAAPEGGKGTCRGDSGGPIKDVKSGEIVGVMSWGEGCGQADKPSVYMRLGSLLEFIKEHM